LGGCLKIEGFELKGFPCLDLDVLDPESPVPLRKAGKLAF
jgi:hypothetical protein